MAKERSPATKTCSTTEPNFVRDYLRGKGNTKELRFSDCKVMVEEGEGWVRKPYVKEDYAWDQETFGSISPCSSVVPFSAQSTAAATYLKL